MIAEEMNLSLKSIDKSDWRIYKFQDISHRITENVKPDEADVDIYIGLEHLDGDDIHIRRKGVPSDVKGGKLRCYPGDIIFGKRRAYQRKAAIVDFDGICSAHAFVFRAKPEVMLPEFFPFFLHSDEFMHRMVDISKGGLSPTINWGDLKDQEFLLPPLNQQKQLAKLLWAMDEVIEKEKKVREGLEDSYSVIIEKNISRDYEDYWLLGDVIKTRKGVTYKSKYYSDEENGIPLLNLKSIEIGGGFNKDGIKYYAGDYKISHLVQNEDLIIACTDITRAGNVVGFPLHPKVYQDKKMIFTMDLVAVTVKDKELLRDYLYYALKTHWIHWRLFANSPGTTVLHLDLNGLNKIRIPKIPLEKQKIIINKLKSFEMSIGLINSKVHSSEQLLRSLIHQIF